MSSEKDNFLVRIIDDEEEVRESLSFLLDLSNWKTVAYSSVECFLSEDDFEKPGCILSDVRMPGLSGLQLQIELKKRGIQLPLIFISGHGDIEMAVEAIQRGALNFLIKPVKKEKLFASLLLALDHNSSCLPAQGLTELVESLSEREKLILKLVLKQLETKIIAERLNISRRTVQGHRWRIYQKLKVSSEEELRQKLKDYKIC